jgi:hypothetical protein
MTEGGQASRMCSIKNEVMQTVRYTQSVQVLLGLCSLRIQDLNYFQNFILFTQNSLPLNQYTAGID